MVVNLLISSKTLQKNDLGNQCVVRLGQPLDIQGKKVRINKMSFWNSFPNVRSDQNNNKVRFTYNSVPIIITLPNGQYSLTDIQESLTENFQNLGLPSNLLEIVGDEATSKVTLKISPAGLSFSMNTLLTDNILFKDLLGFTNGIISTSTAGTFNVDGLLQAALNTVNAVNVNLSFAGGDNIYFNGSQGSTVCETIPITTPPNTQEVFAAFHPQQNSCIGSVITEFTITLKNETNELDLDMNGESFTLHLEIYD